MSAVRAVDAPTAASVVIVNAAGGRKFLHRIGSSDAAFPEPIDFTAAITAVSHCHLASIFTLPLLRTHAATTLAHARAAA